MVTPHLHFDLVDLLNAYVAPVVTQHLDYYFNPLSPDIKMHNYSPYCSHTLLMALVGRICLNIPTSHPW